MSLFKTGSGKWAIDFTCKGKRIKRVIGLSKPEAREAEAAIRSDILRGQYPFGKKMQDISFDNFADEFLELYSKPNKRSWKRDEISLDHLKQFFEGKYLSEIGGDTIEKYRLKRRADGVSLSTINRELACLKTCLSKGVEWERIMRNPAQRIKKFREANFKIRSLTSDETRRLLNAASPELRPVLIVALNTGMRRGEILGLRWKDVDFVKGFILIGDSKSGRSRKVPMNSLVFETLHEMNREREFVFENPDTRTAVKDVKTSFRGACRRAKKNPEDKKDPGIVGLRFHDLRHTAASRMIELGADIMSVKEILGHASVEMTARYCHPTDENKRRAIEKLGEQFKGQVTPKSTLIKIKKPVTSLKTYN